jgi:hypothetical protein
MLQLCFYRFTTNLHELKNTYVTGLTFTPNFDHQSQNVRVILKADIAHAWFDAALGSAMSGIEANDTTGFFPDLDELAIKELFRFLHGCFVVLTFNDLRGLPNVASLV